MAFAEWNSGAAAAVVRGLELLPGQVLGAAAVDAADVDDMTAV